MKRVVAAGLLGLFLLIETGCIAVSAKEVHAGMRYEAVAAADGRLYVVDKTELTAREVTVLPGSELAVP